MWHAQNFFTPVILVHAILFDQPMLYANYISLNLENIHIKTDL